MRESERVPCRKVTTPSFFTGAIVLVLLPACRQLAPAPVDSPRLAPPPAVASVSVPEAPPAPAPVTPTADASAAPPRTCAPLAGPTRLFWFDKNGVAALDREALACLTDPERAAVAYVTPTLGSQCTWAGGPDSGHLDCPLTSALGLGYQCEEPHREFLRHWLPRDAPATCRRWPETAETQEALGELTLTRLGDRVTVAYEASGTTVDLGFLLPGPGKGDSGRKVWSWSETLVFELRGERLMLVSRKTKGTRSKI